MQVISKTPTLAERNISNKGRYYGASVHNGLMLDETIFFDTDEILQSV